MRSMCFSHQLKSSYFVSDDSRRREGRYIIAEGYNAQSLCHGHFNGSHPERAAGFPIELAAECVGRVLRSASEYLSKWRSPALQVDHYPRIGVSKPLSCSEALTMARSQCYLLHACFALLLTRSSQAESIVSQALDYLSSHDKQFDEDLFQLGSVPSISSLSEHASDVLKAGGLGGSKVEEGRP